MTNSLLKPQKVLKDLVVYLPPVYLPLLLINSPSIIFILLPIIILPLTKITATSYLARFLMIIGLIFYPLLEKIYVPLIFPYLQGVSILYIANYLNRVNCNLLDTYQIGFKTFYRLIFGNFILLLRIIIVIIVSLVIYSFGILLAFVKPSIWTIFLLVLISAASLMIIFYCSQLILIPHFIAIERRGVWDSFMQNLELTKYHKIRLFLFLIAGLILSVVLFLMLSFIAKSLLEPAIFDRVVISITVFLCQPLFLVYSVIIYKHLKNNID